MSTMIYETTAALAVTAPAPSPTWSASEVEHVNLSAWLQGRASTPSNRALFLTRPIPEKVWLSGGHLRRPICVVMAGASDGRLTATNPGTGIFGVGGDLAAAITDFRAALREHRDVLEASSALATDLQEQLDLLRNLLQG